MVVSILDREAVKALLVFEGKSSKHFRRVLARGACDVGQDRESMRLSKVCHIHGIDTAVKQDASMSMGLGRWYL